MKKVESAPDGSDLRLILRNRGRQSSFHPLAMEKVNERIKMAHSHEDCVLDEDIGKLLQEEHDKICDAQGTERSKLSRQSIQRSLKILGMNNTRRSTQMQTVRRDEAVNSIRNLISDVCLATDMKDIDPRLLINVDASTIRILGGKDPDKVRIAWAPLGSKSLTSVKKSKPRRNMTAEEKKMKDPNVLPQRAKLLVGGTPRGSTTPIVLVMQLKKSEFTNKANGPFIEKFSFISKDTGPNAQVCSNHFCLHSI